MKPIEEYIGRVEYDANFFGILCAIFVLILTTILWLYFRKKHVIRRTILITGLSESGKTLLFSRLVSSKKITTCTSMKENVAVIKTPTKKNLTLMDIPGNDRLRSKYIEEFLPSARGILFLIDSSTFSKEIRDVAGLLYDFLQEDLVNIYKIPLLILCNKQDIALAKSSKVIRGQLEKEINSLRITRTGRLASISQSKDLLFLGHKGKDFEFSDLKGLRIDFGDCSALEVEGKKPSEVLEPVWTWLTKIA